MNNLCDDDDCLERYHLQCIQTARTISDALCAMSTEQKNEILTTPGLWYDVIKAGEVEILKIILNHLSSDQQYDLLK